MAPRYHFEHGLGDCTHFCHLLACHPGPIEIYCTPDKVPLFRGTATIKDSGNAILCTWDHIVGHDDFGGFHSPWRGNKVGSNIPFIFKAEEQAEIWKKLCTIELNLEKQTPDPIRASIDNLIEQLPRPLVLLHTKANTTGENKNYDDQDTLGFYEEFLDKTQGTLLLLDWDDRMPRLNHARTVHLRDSFKLLNIVELYWLMVRADLFIGVDSGPLHFLRFTRTPGLGLWFRHYPASFALPRENTVHLVPSRWENIDYRRRDDFNTILSPTVTLKPEFVIKHALRLLEAPKYLGAKQHGRDVQLQSFLDRLRFPRHVHHHSSYIDRHHSFDLVFQHLCKQTAPVIVETGCIRSKEDWAGTGYSTYLLGALLKQLGGTLYSIDNSPEHIAFAKAHTEHLGSVQVYQNDSVDWLEKQKTTSLSLSLFYADSADVDTPGYQECCLREVQTAQHFLRADAKILIDDNWYDSQNGRRKRCGKGALAIPWLLANGWKLEFDGYQVLLGRQK